MKTIKNNLITFNAGLGVRRSTNLTIQKCNRTSIIFYGCRNLRWGSSLFPTKWACYLSKLKNENVITRMWHPNDNTFSLIF